MCQSARRNPQSRFLFTSCREERFLRHMTCIMTLVSILRRTPSLAGLEIAELVRLSALASVRTLARGELVWRSGDLPRAMTVIHSRGRSPAASSPSACRRRSKPPFARCLARNTRACSPRTHAALRYSVCRRCSCMRTEAPDIHHGSANCARRFQREINACGFHRRSSPCRRPAAFCRALPGSISRWACRPGASRESGRRTIFASRPGSRIFRSSPSLPPSSSSLHSRSSAMTC